MTNSRRPTRRFALASLSALAAAALLTGCAAGPTARGLAESATASPMASPSAPSSAVATEAIASPPAPSMSTGVTASGKADARDGANRWQPEPTQSPAPTVHPYSGPAPQDCVIPSMLPGYDGPGGTMGSLRLMATGRTPQGWVPLRGQWLPLRWYGNLFGVIGPTFGGETRDAFMAPNATGAWAALDPGRTKTTPCLQWVMNSDGAWPSRRLVYGFPGEVVFTAVPAPARQFDGTGATSVDLGSNVAQGISAYRLPEGWGLLPDDVCIGEARLFGSDAELPSGFQWADGHELRDWDVRPDTIAALLGATYLGPTRDTVLMPKTDAPTGYRWALALSGRAC